MGQEDEEVQKLPLFYRLILRLPKPETDVLGVTEGIFWVIIVPIFLLCEYCLGWVILFAFAFPINVILVSLIPTVIFVFFLRVQLERFINAWNVLTRKGVLKWEVDKMVEEYIQILDKKERKT